MDTTEIFINLLIQVYRYKKRFRSIWLTINSTHITCSCIATYTCISILHSKSHASVFYIRYNEQAIIVSWFTDFHSTLYTAVQVKYLKEQVYV